MLLFGIIALVWAALVAFALVLVRSAGRANRQMDHATHKRRRARKRDDSFTPR